jgi:hypothetical protein
VPAENRRYHIGGFMRVAALAVLASLVTMAACEDIGTTPIPVATSDQTVRFDGSSDNPPPPPIDSGAVGIASGESQSTVQFQIGVTYMLNKPENSGWLKFKRDADDTSIDIDNSAAVRMTNGVFSGKGTIRIVGPDRTFSIDLSKATFGEGTSFAECTAPTTADTKSSCFNLQLGGGVITTADGQKSPATLIVGPDRTRAVCVAGTEACIITAG